MSVYILDPRYEEILQKYEERLSSMETVMGNMAIALQEYQRRFRFQNKAVKFIAEYLLHKFGFNLWLRMRREGPKIDSIEEDEDLAILADQYCHPVIYADQNKVIQPIGIKKVKESPRIYPGQKIPVTSANLVVERSEAPTSFTLVYDNPKIVLEDCSLENPTQHQGTKRTSHDISTSMEDQRQEYIQIPPKVAKTNYVFENESQSQNSNSYVFVETGPRVSTGNASESRSSASSHTSSHSLSRSSTPAGAQITPPGRILTPVAVQSASSSTAHSTASRSNQSSYSIMSTQTDSVVDQAPPPRRSNVIIHKEVPNIIEIDITEDDDETSTSSKSPLIIMPTPVFEMCPYKTEIDINDGASNREGGRQFGEAATISTSSDAPPRSFIKTTSNSHVVEIVYDVSHPSNGQLGYNTAFPDEEQEIPVTSLPRKSKKTVKKGTATPSAAVPSRPSSASQLSTFPQSDETKKQDLASLRVVRQPNDRNSSSVSESSSDSQPPTTADSTKQNFSADAPARKLAIPNQQPNSSDRLSVETSQETKSFDINWLFQMKRYQQGIMPYNIFIKMDELRQWFEYLPRPDPAKSRYRCRFCSKYAMSYGIPKTYLGPAESPEGELRLTEVENRNFIYSHNRKHSHVEIIKRMIKEKNTDLTYVSSFDKQTKRELSRKLES